MTAAGSGNGFGTAAWWGFSPALDLQATCLETSVDHLHLSQDGIPELNILLVGSVDARHILKTMSQAHMWPQKKINFYVLENSLEVLGRQLLFLSLAVEPAEKMGLQEKSEIFLELMGNTLIRSQTAAYLQEKSDLFIRYVTDLDFQRVQLPILDLSALKFKERDQLEAIFRFWRNPDPRAFQIKQLWDLRLRQYLGTRYDARRGVCDWDLTMKLHEHGAKVIGSREFFHWRDTGVAFELREASYDVPNKTLASGRLLRHVSCLIFKELMWPGYARPLLNLLPLVVAGLVSEAGGGPPKGEPVPARGYWGDIATGPYVTFGIESEDASMLKTTNGLPTKSAQEISLHNVTAIFHGLNYHSHYEPPASSDKEENSGSLQEGRDCTKLDVTNSLPSLEGVQVHFLPLSCLSELHHKSKYQELFNLIFFSCSMVHFLKPNLHLVSAPKATLIVELTNFLPDLRKEQVSEFASRVANMVMGAGFAPAKATDQKAFFLFQRGDQKLEKIHSEIPPLGMTEPFR